MIPVIWIDNDNALEVLKAARICLRQGKSMVIFLKGRVPCGTMQPSRAERLSARGLLEKDIIPITVNGDYDIWPETGGSLFLSGK
jgi:hypothetical protein